MIKKSSKERKGHVFTSVGNENTPIVFFHSTWNKLNHLSTYLKWVSANIIMHFVIISGNRYIFNTSQSLKKNPDLQMFRKKSITKSFHLKNSIFLEASHIYDMYHNPISRLFWCTRFLRKKKFKLKAVNTVHTTVYI